MQRAKIQDVARLADVSLGTVSAVMNGKDVVSDKTKRRVLDAVAQLNYHPSLYASNLARQRTKVMGLIVSNLLNPFFAETAQGFEKAALAHGYRVSLAQTNFSPSQLRVCVRQMLGMRLRCSRFSTCPASFLMWEPRARTWGTYALTRGGECFLRSATLSS
jgi:LacI family transcriptional regulator